LEVDYKITKEFESNKLSRKKYDELYDKILECYGKENENGEWIENEESDLCIIGEITAHHFGF
jgi:hypothetical protein